MDPTTTTTTAATSPSTHIAKSCFQSRMWRHLNEYSKYTENMEIYIDTYRAEVMFRAVWTCSPCPPSSLSPGNRHCRSASSPPQEMMQIKINTINPSHCHTTTHPHLCSNLPDVDQKIVTGLHVRLFVLFVFLHFYPQNISFFLFLKSRFLQVLRKNIYLW